MELEEQVYDYCGYAGRPITDYLCVDNQVHSYIDYRSKNGVATTINNKPKNLFSSHDLEELKSDVGDLSDGIALANALEFIKLGFEVPMESVDKYQANFRSSYLLNTALCFAQLTDSIGNISQLFVTKSEPILRKSAYLLAESENKKSIETFRKQLTTDYTELTKGTFNVVTITPELGGFILGKSRINTKSDNVILLPKHVLDNHIKKIVYRIGQKKVKIIYRELGVIRSLVTSLNRDIVADWLHTSDEKEILGVTEGWKNIYECGNLILPNLDDKMNQVVSVPVVGIEDVVIL
ncbi:hypothetical protein [Clostridium sp.]|uniref:hypothetical protein n=1 Tax=Clostridium sp. TaxID=1506 RepID=UPI003217D02A